MPTEKQKRAFKEVLKGTNISQAMKDVGYSLSTSATTGKLTGSDGWKELMDTYLPEDELAEVHKRLLNKKESFSTQLGIQMTDQPHSDAKGALDMAYKLRGSFSADKIEVTLPSPLTNVQ